MPLQLAKGVDGSPPGEIAPEVAVVGTPGMGHRGWEAQSRKDSNSVVREQAALGAVDLDAREDLIGRLGLLKIKSEVVGDVINAATTNPATDLSGEYKALPRRGSTEPSRGPRKVSDRKDSDEAFGEARSFVQHRKSGRAEDARHGPQARLHLVEEEGEDLQHPKRESLELPGGPAIQAGRRVHTQVFRRDSREVKGRSPSLEQVLDRPHEWFDRDAFSVDGKHSVPLLCGMRQCIRRMVSRQSIRPSKKVGGGRGSHLH